jgi:hypothetical protein
VSATKTNGVGFREQMAADLIEDYENVRTLLKAAREAELHVFVDCPNGCGKRLPAKVPNHKVALDAVKLWIETGMGRAAQAVQHDHDDPDTDLDVETLPTADRNAYRRRLSRATS